MVLYVGYHLVILELIAFFDPHKELEKSDYLHSV